MCVCVCVHVRETERGTKRIRESREKNWKRIKMKKEKIIRKSNNCKEVDCRVRNHKNEKEDDLVPAVLSVSMMSRCCPVTWALLDLCLDPLTGLQRREKRGEIRKDERIRR